MLVDPQPFCLRILSRACWPDESETTESLFPCAPHIAIGLPLGSARIATEIDHAYDTFYVTDLLQNVEALVTLGLGDDPRLAHALQAIRDKQDSSGAWPLEYDYRDKTWVDFGPKRQPNPWVTLRALRVLGERATVQTRF